MLLGQYRLRQPTQRASSSRSEVSGGSPDRQTPNHTSLAARFYTHSRQNSVNLDDAQRGESPNDEMDEPISNSVRRRPRSPSSDITEHDRKRLREEAQVLARAHGVPAKQLLELAESPNVPSMVLNLGAMMLRQEMRDEAAVETNTMASLLSKDFLATVRVRLHLCFLSPNITAYVTGVNANIVTFMKAHQALFRAQPKYFEDAKMRAELFKTVSRELSTVRGNIKSALMDSLQNSKSIIDTVQSLAGMKSGMEIGSGHWMRFAFLRRQLRIFVVGMTKDINTIKEHFSVFLLPSMEPDLRTHVADQLGRNLNDLENELQLKMQSIVPVGPPPASTPDTQDRASTVQGSDSAGDADASGTGLAQDGEDSAGEREQEREREEHPVNRDGGNGTAENNGFFKKDGRPRYAEREYWNYVDNSLKKLRDQAIKKTANHKEAEKLFVETLTEIFMMDLHEFPGDRRLRELPAASTNRPEWQKTIEKELLW